MFTSPFAKAGGALAVLMLIIVAVILSSMRVAQAVDNDDNDRNESKVRKGFQIAPVPLNLAGKNPELVGLGSYIVNAQIPCNDCHDAGPATQFTRGFNPFMGQPEKVNPATYLGGGRDFGPYPPLPPNAPPKTPQLTHLFSRNLTPDKTGLPEGGRTYAQFLQIIRTGADLDHLHPNCTAGQTDCLPLPFQGDLLQIMPWPQFQKMTEHDLRAIYEYLSAVPCIEGPTDPSNPLHNDCP